MNTRAMVSSSRLIRRLLIFVWAALLLSATNAEASPVKTMVQDTLYRADGSVAQGSITIRWNDFSTSAGEAVAAGVMTVTTDAKGGIAIPLIPNTGSTPSGSYYRVVMKLDDGTTSEELWVVPATASTTVAAIRAKVVPQAVAAQFVSRDYMDSALATIPNLAAPGVIGSVTPGQVNATDLIPKVSPYIDVRAYGATGNGMTDDSAAIQAAVTASLSLGQCVFFPPTPGGYKIATPVQVASSECLEGVNGAALNTTGTIIRPTTAAFVTINPLVDQTNITIRDFHFIGGTNVIDLGLFHLIKLSDIMCQDYTGWCFSQVRGERHELRNINCWHHTVGAQGCISVADQSNSLFAAQYKAANWTDQWWDRSLIDHVFDIGDNSTTLTDQYVLWSNGGGAGGVGGLSNTNVRWLMGHRAGQSGIVRNYNVQLSEFHDIASDTIGTPTTPVPIVFDVEGYFEYSTLDGLYPRFSSNSYWTTGAYFKGLFLGSTVKNCEVGGDNSTTYGLRFSGNYGSYGQISGCDGAYYNDAANPLWRNYITITGSQMSPSNAAGEISLVDQTNQGASITLMNDSPGANAATSAFKVIHATGLGNSVQTFSVQPTGASFDSGAATFGANGVLKYSTDTGLSRIGAGQLAVGNGTAGDSSGRLQAGNFVAGSGGMRTISTPLHSA